MVPPFWGGEVRGITGAGGGTGCAPLNGVMGRCSLQGVSKGRLLREFSILLGRDRGSSADMLAYVAEIDRRQLYLEQAYPSMFAFCTRKFGMSEAVAAKRIRAGRAACRFPCVLGMVRRGELHLSGVHQLAVHLTEENHEKVLRRAKYRTMREIAELIAEIAPKPDAVCLIRALPRQSAELAGQTTQRQSALLRGGTEQNADVAGGKEVQRARGQPLNGGEVSGATSPAMSGSTSGPSSGATSRATSDATDWAMNRAADGVGGGSVSGVAGSALDGAGSAVAVSAVDGAVSSAISGATHDATDLAMNGAVDGSVDGALGRATDGATNSAGSGASRAQGTAAWGAQAAVPARRARNLTTPLSPGRYRLQVTIGQEARDRLAELRNLLSHQIPDGDLAAVIERALELLLAETKKKRGALAGKSRAGRKKGGGRTRTIPARVRREVFRRDEGRCAFVDGEGRRCESTWQIEFHHCVPYGRDGAHSTDNIELRCRAHNQYEAELEYGRRFMASRRRGGG